MGRDEQPESVSLEQCLLRCRQVDQERESLLREQAALGEHYNLIQRKIDETVAEMQRLGTSPQTIRADLANMTEVLHRKSLTYSEETQRIAVELTKARQAILELEQSFRKDGV